MLLVVSLVADGVMMGELTCVLVIFVRRVVVLIALLAGGGSVDKRVGGDEGAIAVFEDRHR